MASLGRSTRRKSSLATMHQSNSSSSSSSPPTTSRTPATDTAATSDAFASFEALRSLVKSGHESSKELASVMQERADVELAYSKSLAKVALRLRKVCTESSMDQWSKVAEEMAAAAGVHRRAADDLGVGVARPLRQLSELHHKTRKSVEASVEKKAKMVAEWRSREQKGQSKSLVAARNNERVQDGALDLKLGQRRHCTDKELSKMETKRRKSAEETRRADLVYYASCLKAERARLEWESSVVRGCAWMRHLEGERLQRSRQSVAKYAATIIALGPALVESAAPLQGVEEEGVAEVADVQLNVELATSDSSVGELCLPTFFSEDPTNAMNRERRRDALARLLSVVTADMEREKKGKAGLENLAKALEETPKFGNQESKMEVNEKLQHIRSMLNYFDACRLKLMNAMLESEGGEPVDSHPVSKAIACARDSKSGSMRSILRLPFKARQRSPPTWSQPALSAHLPSLEMARRGCGDGVDQTDDLEGEDDLVDDDSEFDDFSDSEDVVNIIDVVNGDVKAASETMATLVALHETGEESCEKDVEEIVLPPIHALANFNEKCLETCVAIYDYQANMSDEMSLRVGDRIVVYEKQPDGWWLGQCNRTVGIFPATYVHVEEIHQGEGEEKQY